MSRTRMDVLNDLSAYVASASRAVRDSEQEGGNRLSHGWVIDTYRHIQHEIGLLQGALTVAASVGGTTEGPERK